MNRQDVQLIRHIVAAIVVAAGVMAIGFAGFLVSRPILIRAGLIDKLCFIDRSRVFQESAVAASADRQLFGMKTKLQREIDEQKLGIARAVDPAARAAGLDKLRADVEGENRKLAQVRRQAIILIIRKIAPIIRREATSAQCTTVLDRSIVVDYGTSLDLTDRVVKAIDREVPPLPSGALEAIEKSEPNSQ